MSKAFVSPTSSMPPPPPGSLQPSSHWTKGPIGKGLLGGATGVIWAITIAVVLAMASSLVTGEAYSPHVTGWFAGGAALGAAYGATDPDRVSITQRRWLFIFATPLVLLSFSGFKPLGLGFGQSALGFLITLAMGSAAFVVAVQRCLAPFATGPLNRFRREQSLMLTLRGFGLVFFGFVVLLPLYVMVMSSLTTQQALYQNPLDLWPDFSQGLLAPFQAYSDIWVEFNFGKYIWNSTLVSVTTVVLTLLFAIPGAYAVSRLDFPGKVGLSRSILAIYLVPVIVLVVPLNVLFGQLGLRGSLLGLMVVYPATTLPVALYMLQGYFRGLPAELEEAGLMDGCSRIRVIWEITMPLALPALASVALYVFMIAWNEFLFAFMFLDDPSTFTLPKAVKSLNSSEISRQNLMAGAVISTVPIVVVFLAAERLMVNGLTSGGVKG